MPLAPSTTAKAFPIFNWISFAQVQKNAFLFLILASLSLTYWVGQDDVIIKGSTFYFLTIGPFLLIPLLEIQSVVTNFASKTLLITGFSLISTWWLILNGQMSAGFQLLFWAYIIAYLTTSSVIINLDAFGKVFLFLIALGFITDAVLGINYYGILISKNHYVNESHHLSLYPNIANSGFFGFIFLVLYTLNLKLVRKYWWILAISFFIVMTSKVRSIQIALVLYALARFFFNRNKNLTTGRFVFFCLLFAAVPLIITSGYQLLYEIAIKNEFLLNFLFRGVDSLSDDTLSGQVYRPLVWAAHWNFFQNSDFWLGVGPEKLDNLVAENLMYGDSVSFITRYMALYGLPFVLFFAQLMYWLLNRAYQRDEWACALFPSIFFLMMSWGSIFHPSSGFALLLLLILIKGKKAFIFQEKSGKC